MFAFNMWELACSPLPSGNWQSPSGTWHLPLETAICQPGTGIYQGGTRIYQVRSGILALTKCELAYWHTGMYQVGTCMHDACTGTGGSPMFTLQTLRRQCFR